MAMLNFFQKGVNIVESPQGTRAFEPIALPGPPLALIELAEEPVVVEETRADVVGEPHEPYVRPRNK